MVNIKCNGWGRGMDYVNSFESCFIVLYCLHGRLCPLHNQKKTEGKIV